MRYVGITLAVLALLWYSTGFAAGPSLIRNPNVQLAPVKARTLTPAQLKAYEQAKAARSPMTKGFAAQKASQATREKRIKKDPSGGTLHFKGRQGGMGPLWDPPTTVFNGDLEWRGFGINLEKNVSFDYDQAGNFYATTDSLGGTSPGKLLYSTDNGATWTWLWAWNTGGGYVHETKVIVAQTDSLFYYLFTVDSLQNARLFRINQSDGSYNFYTLGSGMTRIAAAWDMDTLNPYFHVALLDTSGTVFYVRGTVQGTSWSTPVALSAAGNQCVDIAVGNATQVTDDIFVATTWAGDSSAWCFYDSSGTWADQLVSDADGQACTEASIAASHGNVGDSVRVYVTYTYAYTPSTMDYDIHESYNMQNGENAWTKGYWLATTTDYEWGSSINIPNATAPGGDPGFVNLCYNDDVGDTYTVQQNWLVVGYSSPTNWNGNTTVSYGITHSSTVYPYASGALMGGSFYSVVLYPGTGPTNVYFNASWFTGVEQGPVQVTPKTGFELAAAQPNPFSHNTNIAFSLPKSGNVDLAVYDVAGRKVATLAKGALSAGSHEASFNGSGVPAGVYFYRLNFEGKTLTNRMVVVR